MHENANKAIRYNGSEGKMNKMPDEDSYWLGGISGTPGQARGARGVN